MPAIAHTVMNREALLAVGAPGGPVYNHWVMLMARIDMTAKRKLSNDMVNVRTGNLRSSQAAPVIIVRGNTIVGVAENTAAYAYYVHEGTRPHEIRPVRAKVLRFTPRGAQAPIFRPLVNHPGTRARPWLRTAMEEVLALHT